MDRNTNEVIIPVEMPPELRMKIAQRALCQTGNIAADIYAIVVKAGRPVQGDKE